MKIGLAVHHHSPGYGGPFTAISETANYLFKNDISIKLIYEQNQYTKFDLDFSEIIKSVDILHCFGTWKPFYFKLFYYAKKFKKKNYYFTPRCTRTLGTRTKKIKKKDSLGNISKKNF